MATPSWFEEIMQGCESLSLDKPEDRDILWSIMSAHLLSKRANRVNSLLGDEDKALAYRIEGARLEIPVHLS